jgi:tRNA(Ser,Leu) C12 N-acetylase TAN1
MDLLVSYPWNHFSLARNDVMHALHEFGDIKPEIKRTSTMGIAVVHTSLDNRDVIKRCKELFQQELAFQNAIKWSPVDYWCETDLDAMKKVIEDNIKERIEEGQSWGMQVDKHRWQKFHTNEIVAYLAPAIERKVDLDNPDKIIRVDVVGKETAISLLIPDEIFSVGQTHF